MGKPLLFTRHARTVMEERSIPEEWVAMTIARPDHLEPDPAQKGAFRAFLRIPAFGNRVLRVVYYEEPDTCRVTTVFFDRGARRKGLAT